MSTYVREFGPADGRPLLALHGLSGHGARWQQFAETQLPGFRVIAPDLRGHGRSTWNPPWNFEQYAQDQLTVLDDLGLGKVPVMGHSLGAAIALHMATIVPQRVSQLILLDPAIGLDPATTLEDAEDARADEFFDTLDEARAAQASRWSFADEGQIIAEVEANFAQTGDGRWKRRFTTAMAVTAWSEMSRPHVVPPTSVPTLLVPAKDGEFVTPEFVADCAATLGENLTVREVDSGHMIYLECPDELGKLITGFLS